MLAGRRLIDHAAASLSAHVTDLVIVGRIEPGRTCIPDRPAADMGPLGGLNAALHHAASGRFDGVLTLGCDMPLLPAAVADALIGQTAAVLAGQHLVGYWPGDLAARLDACLATAGDRSIRAWLALTGPRVVGEGLAALPNVNRPEDLAALEVSWPAPA